MGSWGCPHEANDVCERVNKLPCDPGMKGCVLSGRFVFSNPAKNRPVKPDARNKAQGKGGDREAGPAAPTGAAS
jgi:hypothetical protein